MRKVGIVLGGLACVGTFGSVYADVYARTCVTMRPRFELAFPERIVAFRDRIDARDGGHGIAMQLVGFGGQTVDQAGLARYFLPNEKDYIIVGEDASVCAVNNTRDVNAAQFRIVTFPLNEDSKDSGFTKATFESRVQFCPKQETIGLGLTYAQAICKGFWWDFALPVVRVKNTLGMSEFIFNKGNGGAGQSCASCVNNAYQSFTQAVSCNRGDLKYGKMCNGWLNKTGVSQIETRLGHNVLSGSCNVGSYVGLTIPTGNKPNPEYLFSPVTGNNKHWGFLLGAYGSAELLHDDSDRVVSAVFTSVTRFLVPNTQRRSFDLRGKPWSRYVQVWKGNDGIVPTAYASYMDLSAPLINYSTLCVRVHPHYSYDFNFGLNYATNHFRGEVGYNLYARRAEDISFIQPIQSGLGIAAVKKYLDLYPSATLYSNSLATVASPVFKLEATDCAGRCDEVVNVTAPNSEPAYLPITLDDLDRVSAAAPATVSQTLYGSLGFVWDDRKHPLFINFGGSYEFTSDNSTISRWLGWVKFGISI